MKTYSIYQAPLLSFFSIKFYRDIGLNWEGTGFAYLLLLLTVCWIPSTMLLHDALSNYVRNKAPRLISQIPRIVIANGSASTDVAQPYKIIDPDTGKDMAIIDTTGQTTSLSKTEALVLMTKTEAAFRKSNVETRTFSLESISNFTIDQQRVSGWAEVLRRYAAVSLFPLLVIGSFAYRVVAVLIYAAIGLFFAVLVKTRIPYKRAIRLSVMAVTPGIIVSTLLETAHFDIPFAGLLYFLAELVYLFLGVRAAGEKNEQGIVSDHE